MTNGHRIIFQNHSGEDGDYALFTALPQVACEDGGRIQVKAWIGRHVPDGDEQTIDVDDDIYAWYGVQNSSALSGISYHRAVLGNNKNRKGTTFKTAFRNGRGLLVPSMTHTADEGRFKIQAQKDTSRPEVIGIAKRGDKGAIVPVVTMRASPGCSYMFKPATKYYLARVDRVETGETLDLGRIHFRAVIDFSLDAARGKSEVFVTHNEDGKFQVQYRNPPRPQMAAEPEMPSLGTLRHKKDRWSGSITWPDTINTATMVQASGMLIDTLGAKYCWSVNTSQTPNGGVSMKVQFWLRDACRQPDQAYTDDWKTAVERSLGRHDGHMDMGCFPYSAYTSFTRLALAAVT